jgi:hypothetical protein
LPVTNRQLRLYLTGPLTERLPVNLLAEKLQAAQRALFNIATSITGGGRKGPWRAEVLAACQLHFVSAAKGSLDLLAEISDIQHLAERYAAGALGEQSLNTFEKTSTAIVSKDEDRIRQLFPDTSHRSRVLKSFMSLLPEDEADYELEVSTAGKSIRFTSEYRDFVAHISRDEETPEDAVRTITGKLFRIEVSTGARQLGLLVNNRQVVCYYPASMEDSLRELIPGSLVEIEGRASFSADEQIDRIEEVFDARPLQLAPLFWKRIAVGDRLFFLNTPMNIDVDFRDGVWVHEFSPLGILAFAPTRKESLEAFRAEFASAWDFIASEPDDKLTSDAVRLKNALKRIVERTEAVPG